MSPVSMSPDAFVARWAASGGAERSNYALFLTELCDLLEVPRPDPAVPDEARNTYVIDKSVSVRNGDGTTTPGFADLYRQNAFVLETKQGVQQKEADAFNLDAKPKTTKKGHGTRGTAALDAVLLRARAQAERYAKALPDWPPFLLVADVGATLDLYADFTGTGKDYAPFPSPGANRIPLEDLRKESVRETLKAVWLDPLSLDPARRTAKITREVAAALGDLAQTLERDHDPHAIADFLLRCIFTMFAEDTGLLPEASFQTLLRKLRDKPQNLVPQLESLWTTMNTGGFSPALDETLRHFNGGLFQNVKALPLTGRAIDLLIHASTMKWQEVEPAIFGSLLESALDPAERHALGAHYTPRHYVERLVVPTLVEPLRADLAAARAAAFQLDSGGDRAGAIKILRAFHAELCRLRVLDPACGTGNFLYVAYDHLKRLEAEVNADLLGYGVIQSRLELETETVTPDQFLGLEKNERAPAIAELVLWIGHLQWFFRNRPGDAPPEPILKRYANITEMDAILAWDRIEPVLGPDGKPQSDWDGVTYETDPVTGRQVPDADATRPKERYISPRAPDWPAADFIVGNPPYIGNWKMRRDLGSGYVEALRRAYPLVPETADLVMYWWDRAADRVRNPKDRAKRFGLITTNSLGQVFARRVVARHLRADEPLSLALVIPDHPWTVGTGSAAVRVAMTVGTPGRAPGRLQNVLREVPGDLEGVGVELSERAGIVNPDLSLGVDVTRAKRLRSNRGLCSPGVKLHGDGFIVSPEEAAKLGLGTVPGLEKHIRPYRNGRDINQRPRGVLVIDLFGLTADELRAHFPAVYQHVRETVYPHRIHNNEAYRRDNWWLFGRKNTIMRAAIKGLLRYIATTETSKHRFFTFLPGDVLPDNKLIAIGSRDAFHLGVLSSRIHLLWAERNRALLEDRPVYVKSTCFDPFPFPDATEDAKARVRTLAESLDAHRKARLAAHPDLTLTALYNALARLRELEESPAQSPSPRPRGEDVRRTDEGLGETNTESPSPRPRGEDVRRTDEGIRASNAQLPLTDPERDLHTKGLITTLKTIHDDLDRAVFAAYGWPEHESDEEILARLVLLNRERAAEERRGKVRWLRPEVQDPKEIARNAAQDELVTVEPKETDAEAEPKGKLPWPVGLPARAAALAALLRVQTAPATVEDLAAEFTRARRTDVETLLETLTELGTARKIGEAYTI